MRRFFGIQYMRALAPIYSHKVIGFKETQIGFDPIQKRNLNPKRKVKTRMSVDRPVDRPMPRSTAPVDRAQRRVKACPSVDRAVDRFLPRSTGRLTVMFLCTFVHAGRPASSTGRPAADREHNLVCSNAPFLAP